MMRTTKFLFSIFVLLFIAINVNAQDKFKTQAMFVYNFTRMNAWPQASQTEDFVIGIYGSSPVFNELSEIAQSRQVGTRKIVLKQFNSIDDVTKCDIVFVAPSQSRQIEAINQKLVEGRIAALLITEGRNTLANGAAVNFVLENDRQRYEVSEANARSLGITLGADMIRLSSSAK